MHRYAIDWFLFVHCRNNCTFWCASYVFNYPLVSLPLTRRQQPPVNPFGHLYWTSERTRGLERRPQTKKEAQRIHRGGRSKRGSRGERKIREHGAIWKKGTKGTERHKQSELWTKPEQWNLCQNKEINLGNRQNDVWTATTERAEDKTSLSAKEAVSITMQATKSRLNYNSWMCWEITWDSTSLSAKGSVK